MFLKNHLCLKARMNHLYLMNLLFLGDLVIQLLPKCLKNHLYLINPKSHLFLKFHLFLEDLVDLQGL
jgi:hypothetical protein